MSDEARLRLERTKWRLACLHAEQGRDDAIAKRDRLRREVEALRDEARAATLHFEARDARDLATAVVRRLDAILRGES